MSKQILLPTSVKSEIMQTYKVERKPLERALKYQNNSSTAQMLRIMAKNGMKTTSGKRSANQSVTAYRRSRCTT